MADERMNEVRLITLDPGHFHAALLQREMLPGIARRVHVYAPPGPDLLAHLQRVHGFNTRADKPTAWELEVHASADFLARLLAERPGNVVVLSGANRDKIARVHALVGAGLHALVDKPWIIEAEELLTLEQTLGQARRNRVVAYDVMTERHEVSCLLQKELVNDGEIFGTCQPGSLAEPAVYLESVHYLKKEVGGAPLLRPTWFFDSRQQGEPLADVGTHLVDLVQWTLAPERVLDPRREVAVLAGSCGTIPLSREQFRGVTGAADFPPFLQKSVREGRLDYVSRNRVDYTLRGVHVKLDVRWDYEAAPGGKDTKLAIFRGSRARVELRQGREEQYVPELYVVPQAAADRAGVERALRQRLARLQPTLPGLAVRPDGARFHVTIPAALRVSHEAHFALLVRQFLTYLRNPDLVPDWELSYMLAKYRVTTEGVRLGRLSSPAGTRAAAR